MVSRTVLGYLAALGAISIYAGMFTVGRAGAAAGLDGYDQTALRFAVSSVLIVPVGVFALRAIFAKIGLWRCIVLAMLNGATYSAVFLGALTFAPVAYGAALVPGLQPFVVMALSFALLSSRSPRHVVFGNTICLLGLAAVLADQIGGWSADDAIGVALFLCAACMWGAYAFFVKLWDVNASRALIIIGTLSPVLFLPFYIGFRGFAIASADPWAVGLQLVYQGGLVGIVAVFLYPFAISVLGSTKVATLSPAMPLLATLIGVFLLGEIPSALQWVGVAIVTTGLAISQLGNLSVKRQIL